MKKILKITAAVIGVLFLSIVLLVASIFLPNQKPRSGPDLGHGIEQIGDSIATTYLFEVNGGKIVLIDAGVSPDAKPILDSLSKRGKSANDVVAIFVTHSHSDHIGGILNFPKAKIYAMKEEVALLEGREALTSPISYVAGRYNKIPVKVTNPLSDGETVDVEGLKVTAFSVPGHTSGSALYLARGVLFFGDIIGISRDQKIANPVRIFSSDVHVSNHSLAQAFKKLEPRLNEVAFLTSSHSGSLAAAQGIPALREFLASHH